MHFGILEGFAGGCSLELFLLGLVTFDRGAWLWRLAIVSVVVGHSFRKEPAQEQILQPHPLLRVMVTEPAQDIP